MANLRHHYDQLKEYESRFPVLVEENRQLKEANARAAHSQSDTQSMQTQIKMMQDELNNSTMRYNQLEGAKTMAERKLAKYDEQLRDALQKVRFSPNEKTHCVSIFSRNCQLKKYLRC